MRTVGVRGRFERRRKRFQELGLLGLQPHQLFRPAALRSADDILPERHPIIHRGTPVGSMGSCFAREVKEFLASSGFNYVERGSGKHLRHGSAPWDRVYNTACIRQEIARAYGEFTPRLMPLPDGTVLDPFRKGALFGSMDEASRECGEYVAAAKAALTDSAVFVLTLGLSEIWYDVQSGDVFAEALPAAAFRREAHGFRLLSPAENAANLRKAIDLLHDRNPALEIILTVSPIPLRATFFDRSAIVSNNVSKASLIYAAHEIAEVYPFVHYFPSYEMTFFLLDDPFEWDARHLKADAVAEIMKGFAAVFVASPTD